MRVFLQQLGGYLSGWGLRTDAPRRRSFLSLYALLLPIFGGLRELHPILGKPQPRFFIDRVPSSLSLSQALLSLIEEPVCIGLAHHKTMRKIQTRPLPKLN